MTKLTNQSTKKPTPKQKEPSSTEIETITTFHGFNYDKHAGCPLFFLTLRAQLPDHPLAAGISTENDDGTITTEHLSPHLIANIINTTFEHHTQHLTTEYVALQLIQINQRYTKQLYNNCFGLRSQTYFTLIFRQDPSITDAIDTTLVLEQLCSIVFTNWIHTSAVDLANRKHNNTHTSPIQPRSIDQLKKPKLSSSPWTPYLDLYLPACNHHSDVAFAILTGLPTSVDYFANRRFLLHLNERLYHILLPHLPQIMQDYSTYPNLIGLRTGKFTSSSPSPRSHDVTYVAASHIDRFESLYKAQHKHF
jgi:hypothetical protein